MFCFSDFNRKLMTSIQTNGYTLSRLFFISLHIFNGWNIRLPHYHKFGTNYKALERCYDSTFFLLQQIIMKKKETTSGRPNKTQLYIIIFIEFSIMDFLPNAIAWVWNFLWSVIWHGNNSVNGHRTIKLHGAIWLFLESFFRFQGADSFRFVVLKALLLSLRALSTRSD